MDERAGQFDAPLDVATLQASLTGLRLAWRVTYFPEIGSTNTYAMGLARQGEAEGAVVTTDHQIAGRGRMGRVWQALPYQQLILSLLLRPTCPAQLVMMASALAVVEAIERETGLTATLKWPNDVLVNGRKVCGILLETSEGAVVVGIGLNVNGSLA
ncbi:MAG TPA: biotin--[acetyl-CoA-carboxylase] ligase, partial [Ktedonobacterales bacterium]|nr:biotin--[acetyl-CoA-carboxylase] ligase [Ktedonobacterales bacterium]